MIDNNTLIVGIVFRCYQNTPHAWVHSFRCPKLTEWLPLDWLAVRDGTFWEHLVDVNGIPLAPQWNSFKMWMGKDTKHNIMTGCFPNCWRFWFPNKTKTSNSIVAISKRIQVIFVLICIMVWILPFCNKLLQNLLSFPLFSLYAIRLVMFLIW